MNQQDLKIGMHLTADLSALPVYSNKDASGPILDTISKGSYIGQIADLTDGEDGLVAFFTGETANNIEKQDEPVEYYLFNWIPLTKLAISARFNDIANAVSDKQIEKQNGAISIAENEGISLKNEIKKVAKGATEIVTDTTNEVLSTTFSNLAPWLIGGAVLYYLTNKKSKK